MKSDYKTACILIDENDLRDFKDSYGYAISKESLWVPLGFLPMMQVILQEPEGSYYIPKIIEEDESSVYTKRIYSESQNFLKQLLLDNKMVDEINDSFPIEYFWFCLWAGTYRIITFCNDFLNQYSVEEVVLIKRKKLVNEGGLVISIASFTSLVEAFFKAKDVKVKILEHQDCQARPKTIFYGQTHGFKSLLKHLIQFVYWKALSFNQKNFNYIMVNPTYDNVINYFKYFKASKYPVNKMSPQVFRDGQMPFLHSFLKSLRFLITSILFKYKYSDETKNIVKPYESSLHNLKFDFTEKFSGTIVQYLSDVRWMKNYIDLFWHNCLEKGREYLTVFSLSPVHLESYFLIRKTKESNGKVAVWQHGGFYGYVDNFTHYITDYKNADYFLSFGKCNIEDITKCMGETFIDYVEVGSNAMYAKSVLSNFKTGKLSNLQGLFIPYVIGTSYSESSVKWHGNLQFRAVKQILDFFGSGAGGKVVVKGLKNHKPHHELQRYIEMKGYKCISYVDIAIERALSNNPKYVVLDNSSTPLLQVLSQYVGPIFLMINQESFSIRGDALTLLKRRVVCSASVDELEMQLTDFLETGSLEGVNIEDTSFVDVYLKQFCYQNYERFIQETTQ